MTDPLEIRALEQAAEFVARLDLPDDADEKLLGLIRSAFGAGWVTGWYEGGRDASALVQRFMERMR